MRGITDWEVIRALIRIRAVAFAHGFALFGLALLGVIVYPFLLVMYWMLTVDEYERDNERLKRRVWECYKCIFWRILDE